MAAFAEWRNLAQNGHRQVARQVLTLPCRSTVRRERDLNVNVSTMAFRYPPPDADRVRTLAGLPGMAGRLANPTAHAIASLATLSPCHARNG